LKPKEFINKLKPDALKIQKNHGIPAAVIIAQAALETGWLRHPIKDKYTGKYAYNLFGIKAAGGWSGETVTINTHEIIDNKRVDIEAEFRAYDSYAESILDHMNFLFENPRYKEVLKKDDPIEFARGLQKAGYATDPDYAKKLISIMKSHDLLELNPKNKSENEFTDIDPGHWCYAAAVRLKNEGIVTGFEDGSFKPDQSITRAEMVVILDRLLEGLKFEIVRG